MHSCTKHPHEHAAASCRRCALPWCKECLVYTYGPSKPPFCIACAMVAAGVKTSGAPPAASRKELRAQRKAFKKATKGQPADDGAQPAQGGAEVEADAARSAEPTAAGASEPGSMWVEDHAPVRDTVADWTTPWWKLAEPDNPAPVD